jgi:cell wall-associated NlpC family hydrolase
VNGPVCRILNGAMAVVVAGLVTGCASKGGVATPRPFPGGPVPPGVTAPVPPVVAGPSTPAPQPVPVPALIATALALKGTPYRYSGTDPSGFDCSGFVQWVFAQHGTSVPREVRDQYRVGKKIDEDEVKPGDLLFFETVTKGASHVGIAIGNGEFIHAPSSKGVVRVERYTSTYWAQRFVGARRVT